jgi:hypothetical protein
MIAQSVSAESTTGLLRGKAMNMKKLLVVVVVVAAVAGVGYLIAQKQGQGELDA